MSIRALRKDVARLKTALAQKVAQKAEAVKG
jgi:ribosomal protein L29